MGMDIILQDVYLDVRNETEFWETIIAIPTAIKILNWLASLWSGCMYYILCLYILGMLEIKS